MSVVATTCSVIVATRNRPRELSRCLSALAAQTHPMTAIEVLVVDDGGDADIRPVVERHARDLTVRIVRQLSIGPSTARNEGARRARGRLLAFIDDDAVASPGWVAALVAAHEIAPQDALGGPVLALGPCGRFAHTSQLAAEGAREAHAASGEAFAAACNLAVPAEPFRRIGGFDPSYAVAEDRDLCDRWRGFGWRVRLVPDAIVSHRHPSSLGAFWRTHFRYGRGAFAYHRGRARDGRLASGLAVSRRTAHAAISRAERRPSILALIATWQLANAMGAVREAISVTARGLEEPGR